MPVDRGAIDAQLRDIGEGERWWEQREFRDLPHVLYPDEKLQGLINGKLLGRMRPRVLPASRWLVVATTQRLLFLKMERFGRQQVELPVEQITGIQHRRRMRTIQITIDAGQRKYRVLVPKEEAFRFIGALAPLAPRLGAAGEAFGSPAIPRLSGLLARVSGPTTDYATRAELARVEGVVERLENEVERLQQHIDFLEKLLQKRSEDAFSLPGPAAD